LFQAKKKLQVEDLERFGFQTIKLLSLQVLFFGTGNGDVHNDCDVTRALQVLHLVKSLVRVLYRSPVWVSTAATRLAIIQFNNDRILAPVFRRKCSLVRMEV
jgi:hypothetical protein